MDTSNKIVSENELMHLLAVWRFKDEVIVFTNGCFDLLHPGHISYLEKARSLGDRLIVGLNSDESVQRLKGAGRPINNQHDRARILAALHCTDAVVLFEEDTPIRLIELVKPNILTKGGDYTIEKVAGADFVKSYGGQVKILPFEPGYSSTGILQKLKPC
ncbi:MAG: D-glycero-beta-D-manno-heptose 1-phosphate adenylyltransferase [Flavobacteriales bacterium]|nr:D-glycero-beta-D-manno-heptose 1-phosphate adenylyltransferase [Flavobacteriales bacterium]